MELYHQILAQYLALSGCFEDMIDESEEAASYEK